MLSNRKGLPVAFAKDGTPISLISVATIETVFNPEIIRRQNLQRREAVFAGVQGRSAGDVGDDVQKLIKETNLPPPASPTLSRFRPLLALAPCNPLPELGFVTTVKCSAIIFYVD